MEDGLVLFCKSDFCCFRIIFWGGIFGGGHYNRSDPYLNSTIVLFGGLIGEAVTAS